MKKKITYIVLSIVICLFVGFLSSIATQSSVNTWYSTLNKPDFNPPNWVFAPTWSLLYILMGIASGMVWSKGFYHIWVRTALYLFGFQLLLNATWSILFFGFRSPFWALMIIILLLAMITLTMRWFWVVSKKAAWLMAPYLAWVCFAMILNYKIWELN